MSVQCPNSLVQTLVVREGKVLLGRWLTGSLKGRVTGLVGRISPSQGGRPRTPEIAAANVCRNLIGQGALVDPRRLRRRGLFTFEERGSEAAAAKEFGTKYEEHELVLYLGPQETFEPAVSESFEPVGWFGQHEIPYGEMPKDDKVWYEDVIYKSQRLKGHFLFDDVKLVDYSIQTVDAAEGLCELTSGGKAGTDEPLLLQNPACSKCRNMYQALEKRSIHFRDRKYLEDPLSISELETVLARIRNVENVDADVLCRDSALIEQCARGATVDLGRGKEELLLEQIALQPDIMQRPIVVRGQQAAIGRPTPDEAMQLFSE